jgi:putative methyltransferase (TIGR04325 family)
MRKLLHLLKDAPLVRVLREARFDRAFARAHGMNLFRGVYTSFAEAEASAPATKPIGYDHPAPAAMYDERMSRVHPADYPVLFWLGSIMTSTRRVFDFGGHVGIAHYAFERYLGYPEDLVWTVLDVAAVVERGRRLAAESARKGLVFTSDIAEASGADVFLAAGSLQYVREPLDAMLTGLQELPRHVVINKTPLYDGESFVTLQSIGTAFCPYAIFNRVAFIERVCALGYELVDSWENVELSCSVALRRDKIVPRYTGLYFRRSFG